MSFWKHAGETLAVMLRRFREEHSLCDDEKLTYAGRLDPMAEGIVPILVGEARFQKDHLLGKAKTYEVDIVLGLSTDTGDLLGLLINENLSARKFLAEIQKAVETLSELKELAYPNYSSRPVEGKPLFMHARAGNKVTLPVKKITIHELELLGIKEVALCALLGNAQEIIAKVQGDFRQAEIMAQWRKMMEADGDKQITIVTIRTTVSSGTYMRSLAEKMGELLGVPALAGRIVRTNLEGME
ncbi:MAG: ine55 [Candidatus Nomurabacteria bacterium]|nr:ine55 [Candidatus Nomurabacteria bacterium]